MVDEQPLFFRNGSTALFGVLHKPHGTQVRPAFVFCHAFAEEKLWTHRVLVSYARQVAAAGHPVLRFDYMGNGDSEGAFSDSSLASACSDVRCAIEHVQRLTGADAVGLLGLRFGAAVASLVADDVPNLRYLVLWAPVVDGERYMQDLLRINVTTQMATFKEIRQDRPAMVEAMRSGQTVNVDGYEIGFPMFSEVSAIKLASQRHRLAGPCLIAQIDRMERPSAELQALASMYSHASVAFAKEEPFWKEIPQSYQAGAPNLFAITNEWLGAQR